MSAPVSADHQFRNTGTLMRDGFMVAQFEDDAKEYPKQVGKLYIDGNWFDVLQARELRDFLNRILPEDCEVCKGSGFRTVRMLDGFDADDQPCYRCNPNGDSRNAP